MLSTSLRRALAAAVAVPALVLSSAACGSGDDGGGDGKKRSGGTSGGSESDGGGEDSEAKPLTKAQLKKALLKTGDLKGYKSTPKDEVFGTEEKVQPDPSECEPLTDSADAEPKYSRSAYEATAVSPAGKSISANVHQVLLSSYAEGEASSWLDEMHGALESCQNFTMKVEGKPATFQITKGQQVGIGDDAVQYTMENKTKGEGVPMTFTVIRSGANTATFTSVALSGDPKPPPEKLLTTQYEKLAAAGA
ncbi:sensor domain-containing protein [Streptomyces oceani]|uniref:Uncharacterized protein n=1 Tax=Streptomyces oceani TaxID=1075402 RepID=A0A1E7KN54_9ACTN|nr:sensor domain-containing protein [Streptomyces oceani]OEV05340.1 hypothetical protein AN216_03300 [Streptomyces oceani]